MKNVLENMGEKMSDGEIQDLITAVDKDGDGEVDVDEFLSAVMM